VSRLLLLNGPPGIGKSTIAERYAAEHPGVLRCDIDVLRTLVGGADHAASGELIRPAAIAMISAYLASGHDVVLPQLFSRVPELERFEEAAASVGAAFVECLLMDTEERSIARFHARGGPTPQGWHARVRRVVADEGGDRVLARYHRALVDLLAARPATTVVQSVDGDPEGTYRAVARLMA
jgi:predicted kinase